MADSKKITENSEELLEVMANYKFVLVLEKTVCEGKSNAKLSWYYWYALAYFVFGDFNSMS